MRKLSKTLLSLLLIAAMLASFVVLPAAAEEPAAEQPTEAVQAAETQAADSSFMKIFHLDGGRKYFTKDWILALINEISAAGYTHLQLAIGNDGMRFLLDDMSLTVGDKTYSSEDVAAAIHAGNVAYDNRQSYTPEKDELTESEMNAIISYATSKGITVIPLINNPGHMDAILSAATSLTGTTCSYNGSVTTINLENEDAVAFTKAFLTKYVEYFAAKGCTHFGIGADEYANDVYSTGSMGFGQLALTGKYSLFVNYVNEVATIVSEASEKKMKPVAFNDGFYFNGNTTSGTFSTDIVISFWTSGWGGYQSETASQLAARGHQMINTNGDFYYVLGKSDKFDSGYDYASKFSNTAFMGSTVSNPAGATFCVWCDYPGAETEQEIAQKIRLPLRAMAQRMKGESVVLDENKLVSGGFKADGTINTDVDAAEDAATGIKVSAPGVKTVDVTAKTDNLPEVTGAVEVLAWEVTPRDADGNAYTGEGTVTLRIPEAWIGANVYGAVVNAADGSLTTIKENVTLNETESTITFTVPHFSTVLAVKENKSNTIDLTVGKTTTLKLNGNRMQGKENPLLDNAIAKVTGEYKHQKTGVKAEKLNSISANDEFVISDGTNYLYLDPSDKSLSNTKKLEEATKWKWVSSGNGFQLKTVNDSAASTKNYYLTYSWDYDSWSNKLSVTDNDASIWDYTSENGFRIISGSYRNYHIAYNYGWTATRSSGKTGHPYELKDVYTDNTILTITGKSVGTTTLTLGNETYNISVSAVDLTKVEPLTVEYWITNARPTGSDNKQALTIAAASAGVATDDGVDISTLIPEKATKDGRTLYYWRSRLLDPTKTNTSTSGTEKQTEDSGDDDTYSGVGFTRVRFYGTSWQLLTEKNEWQDISVDNYQLVAYYLEYIKVTDEVESFAADWGNKGDNTVGGWLDSSDYCSLSIQVVYEDGTTNPADTTATDLKAKTIVYGYWPNGRGIGTVMFEGAEYEIYKVTAETGEVTASISGNNSTGYKANVTRLAWDENETTVWEGDPSATASVHNSANNFSKEGALENLTWDENQEAILLRVYVKAKPKADSLKVRYIDKTTGKQIHEYDINVKANTYFDPGFAKGTGKNTLVNNEVINYYDVTQKVSAELKDMPQISAAYRYSDYELVEVVRKTDKEVILYYTFNNKHTFVVDFGVPLKIKATDIGVTVPAGDSYWTEATCTGAVYGETKIANGEGLTYTATKPMLGIETLNVTLATGTGEDDKVTHTIYLVPATTVYYEQDVATYSDGWALQGTEIAADKYQETQKGRTQGCNFGHDPYYEENQVGANGSVKYTTTPGETAQLTFKGTGMELYLRTQNANNTTDPKDTTGEINDVSNHSYMLVQVYAGETADTNNLKRMSFVDVNNLFVKKDEQFGYNTPCWTVDGMTYDTYTVVVRYVKGTTYGLAIDGFRVTNTLNPDNATTKDFYAAVHEDNMQTSEIRNMVLKQAEVYNLADNWYKVGNEVIDAVYDAEDAARIINGAVLIKQNYDQNGGTDVQVTSDLVNIGPKNEIYLNPGEAVVMELPTTYTTVQVGMRSLTGDTVTYKINSEPTKEMKSTVDMYYRVALADGGKLVIQNKSDSKQILALTKLKVTGAGTTTNDVSVETTPEAIRYAMALMRGIDVPQFTDVAEDAWYHDYVYDLVYRGVVNGMTATTYEPEGKLTRAQFVKLLACSLADAETLKTYEGKHPFKDSEGHWAEAYIAWAKDKGIVEGVSATEFEPEAPITREQMATIFGRYALKQGIELPKSDNAAGSFPDADKISEYAREFVELMRIAGILNGYEDGTFRPQGNATRAEAAKLFSLFLSITDKLAK